MGCDIHCYIEFKEKDDNRWRSFGERINPGRNYLMFAVLAGVRTDNPSDALIPARGPLNDMGFSADNDAYLYIHDTDGEHSEGTTKERAKDFVEKQGCHYKNNNEGKPTWVSHPDWHSHSWLTTAEFKAALERYTVLEVKDWEEEESYRKEDIKKWREAGDADSVIAMLEKPMPHDIAPGYQAVLAAMQKFEELGFDCRLVFWFDN
jgi:hypothetical protein